MDAIQSVDLKDTQKEEILNVPSATARLNNIIKSLVGNVDTELSKLEDGFNYLDTRTQSMLDITKTLDVSTTNDIILENINKKDGATYNYKDTSIYMFTVTKANVDGEVWLEVDGYSKRRVLKGDHVDLDVGDLDVGNLYIVIIGLAEPDSEIPLETVPHWHLYKIDKDLDTSALEEYINEQISILDAKITKSPVSQEDITAEIVKYFTDNPDVDRTDAEVNALIAQYHVDNPPKLIEGTGGVIFNLTSTTPSGMLRDDVDSLINSKLADKIASLPVDTKTVYIHEVKPFYSGLMQVPQSSGMVHPRSYTDDHYRDIQVATTETEVFSFSVASPWSGGTFDGFSFGSLPYAYNVIRRIKIDDAGTILENKLIKVESTTSNAGTANYPMRAPSPLKLEVSPDGKMLVVAMSDGNIHTYVPNLSDEWSRVHTFNVNTLQAGYVIEDISISGTGEYMAVRTYQGSSYNFYMYSAVNGTWSMRQKVTSEPTGYNRIQGMVLSKDAKELHFMAYMRLTVNYGDTQCFAIVTRDSPSDDFDSVTNVSDLSKDYLYDPRGEITTSSSTTTPNELLPNMYRISGDGKMLFISYGNEIRSYIRVPIVGNKTPWQYHETTHSGNGYFGNSFDVSLTGRTIVVADTNGQSLKIYRKV